MVVLYCFRAVFHSFLFFGHVKSLFEDESLFVKGYFCCYMLLLQYPGEHVMRKDYHRMVGSSMLQTKSYQ